MNLSSKKIVFSVVISFFLILPNGVVAGDNVEFKTSPVTNNGKKWRIGYLEGGPFLNYSSILRALVDSLADLGWIKKTPLPQGRNETETRTLWRFLGESARSNYLEFVPDAYWASDWKNDLHEKNREKIISRFKRKNDIDLMLALGTLAGLSLANNRHKTPTMVLSTSNAVQAGIIKSVGDSGYDHIHARVDPKRFERQIRLFHECVGFKTLGIAFFNTVEGKSFAAVDDVIRVADQLGFDVIECHLTPGVDTGSKSAKALAECHDKLAPRIDAIYITDNLGLTPGNMPRLLEPLFKYDVAMFAQSRYELVKYGILMGAVRKTYSADGLFYAETFAKILNGAKPRDLPQIFESPLQIAVNLETASKTGCHLPVDILAGAQDIHKKIHNFDEADENEIP